MKKKRNIIITMIVSMLIICSFNGVSSFAMEIGQDSSDNSSGIGTVIAPGEDEPLRDNPETIPGQWIYNNTVGKWWYRHTDGTYTSNDWEYINGKWYHFDSAGWMQTGWLYVGGKWYYLNPSTGAMVTGWRQISNNVGSYWYFFKPSGQMVTGWTNVQGYTYYFNSNGQYRETVRRAIVVGDDNNERGMDLTGWKNCLNNMTFKGEAFDRVEKNANLTYTQFCSLIDDVMSDAEESDVTYLSITCHGSSSGDIYICSNFAISGQNLRNLLEPYEGKIILFLNCCYSGTIIHEIDSSYPEMDFLSAFTDEPDSGELLDSKYLVLCSSAYNEYSWKYRYGNTSYWIAYANRYWTRGGGWDLENNQSYNLMYADDNEDEIVTLDELYSYSSLNVTQQHIVVYPENSNFTIFAQN